MLDDGATDRTLENLLDYGDRFTTLTPGRLGRTATLAQAGETFRIIRMSIAMHVKARDVGVFKYSVLIVLMVNL